MNLLIDLLSALQSVPVDYHQAPALCFGWLALAAPTAIGALMGHQKNKRAQEVESSDRKLAAETARYSPWTGMKPQEIRTAGSQFGDMAGGALSGFGVGQSAYGMFNQPKTTFGGNTNDLVSAKGYQNEDYYKKLMELNQG
jgi:hypothetical protein